MYFSIASGKAVSFGGEAPLSSQDLMAWCWLHQTKLTDAELMLIRHIDGAVFKDRRPKPTAKTT